MISIEKWMILTPLQKLPNNVSDLGKIIIATCFEWLPKVQKIALPSHTATNMKLRCKCWLLSIEQKSIESERTVQLWRSHSNSKRNLGQVKER